MSESFLETETMLGYLFTFRFAATRNIIQILHVRTFCMDMETKIQWWTTKTKKILLNQNLKDY